MTEKRSALWRPWRSPRIEPTGLWAELVAASVAIALYARTLGFELVFDDHSLIDEHGPRLVGGYWLPYRPLRFFSLWLDYHVGGGQGWAYHLSNVALHASAAILVLRLCRRAGASSVLALGATLWFVCHPLVVEAVAYVAGRRDLLAAACGLAALVAWTSPRGAGRWAIVFVMLAVAAKEVGILFIPVLLAASASGNGPPLRSALGPVAFVSLAAVALPVAYGAQGPLAPHGPLATKMLVAGSLAAHYLGHVFVPGSFSVEYPALRCTSAACTNLAGPGAVAGIVLLASAVGAALVGVLRASGRPAPYGWASLALCWSAIWLAAISFVVGAHEPGADRHAYVLLAAIAVAFAAFAARARRSHQAVIAAFLLASSAILALVAREQIAVWQNDRTLWRAAVRTSSSSARVHHNLAAALAEQGRFGSARRHLVRAAEIDPSYWPSMLGFAGIDCARGRFAAARVRMEEARALGAGGDEIARVEQQCAWSKRKR